MKKRFLTIVITFLLVFSMVFTSEAGSISGSINDAKKKTEDTKANLGAAKEKMKKLETAKLKLETYLNDLNSQFIELGKSLTELENQSAAKQTELQVTQEELRAAKDMEQSQYSDMKKRMKFMYETQDSAMIEIILAADDLADLLNRADYATKIAKYDRLMLDRYKETRDSIAQKEADIIKEQEALVKLQQEIENKQGEVTALVQSTGQKLNAYTNEIAEAQKEVDGYASSLQTQQGILDNLMKKAKEEEEKAARKLEQEKVAAKAKEDAAAKAEKAAHNQNKKENGEDGKSQDGKEDQKPVSDKPASASDVAMLAALIQCEAGGEEYVGQLAVGSVVMNRVRSGAYPNSIVGVIYQEGQFGPVSSGRFLMVLSQGANASCKRAAGEAMGGVSNIGTALHFNRAGSAEGTVIGNHVFY